MSEYIVPEVKNEAKNNQTNDHIVPEVPAKNETFPGIPETCRKIANRLSKNKEVAKKRQYKLRHTSTASHENPVTVASFTTEIGTLPKKRNFGDPSCGTTDQVLLEAKFHFNNRSAEPNRKVTQQESSTEEPQQNVAKSKEIADEEKSELDGLVENHEKGQKEHWTDVQKNKQVSDYVACVALSVGKYTDSDNDDCDNFVTQMGNLSIA